MTSQNFRSCLRNLLLFKALPGTTNFEVGIEDEEAGFAEAEDKTGMAHPLAADFWRLVLLSASTMVWILSMTKE